MKMIIVALCALVAVAIAAPVQEAPTVNVVRSDFKQEPDGSYTRYTETDDGVILQETGELKEVLNEENKPVKVIVVRGLYTIPDAEGHPQTINYQADENGYTAEGDTIPKAPEVQRR